MTTVDENQAVTTRPGPARARRRRWLFLAAPALLLGGLLGAKAYAFGPRGEPSPEQMERGIDRALDHLDATPDQRTRIKATLGRLLPEAKALYAEKTRLREAGRAALAADPIDENEVERLRREVLKLADKGSSLMSRAVVEVGGVLTPQQRKQALNMLEGRRHGWH